ncbi:SMAD/FHA domain-containing protein [Artemisia annua]|uniref:SMAD/FHA domain-containing protein n=1 Tax=Artemisia annua TaxID=35608 RepID=A0A2U1KP84_ARTAN|nr:SMAD/FHA domain-containing protein [Artemisia annua]
MEEQNPSSSSTNIKLMIEKGPKEGESIEYKSTKLIKIGRVVRGNTFQIKESGISSNHISIHFDFNKWMLTDLDSSNGTFLNGEKLEPGVPTALNEGDCIKIGELTSIIVKIGMVVEEGGGLRRNARRQGRSKGVVEEMSELGLGLDDKLEEGVGKRNLRGREKKGVESTKNVVESGSSKRILRSSKKAEKVVEVPELSKIPEETTDVVVAAAVEPKNKRGRKKKVLPVDVSEGTGLDEGKPAEVVVALVVDRRTRSGRKEVAVEPLKNVERGGIEENVNDGNETVRVDEGNEANNEPTQDQVVEKLVLMEEGRDGKESAVEGSSVKGLSEAAHMDKGKKVAEELENRQDGAEGSMKKNEPDSRKWDLEKMTLGDFFDYLEEQLPKQIIDESEKIIADLEEKARQCYRIRQKNVISKGKQATN